MKQIALLGPPIIGKRTLLKVLGKRRYGKVRYEEVGDVAGLHHLEISTGRFWSRTLARRITSATGPMFEPEPIYRLVLEASSAAVFAFTVPYQYPESERPLTFQEPYYKLFSEQVESLGLPKEAIRIILTQADLLEQFGPLPKELQERIDLRTSSVTGEGLDEFMAMVKGLDATA